MHKHLFLKIWDFFLQWFYWKHFLYLWSRIILFFLWPRCTDRVFSWSPTVSSALLCSSLPPFLTGLLYGSPPSTLRETPNFSPECELWYVWILSCWSMFLLYRIQWKLWLLSRLFIYLCAYEAGTRATLCVWRSKDNLWGLVSPSILWVPEMELMLPAFGFKCLFLLFHLAIPWEFLIKKICQILLNKCSTSADKIMYLFFNIEIIPV